MLTKVNLREKYQPKIFASLLVISFYALLLCSACADQSLYLINALNSDNDEINVSDEYNLSNNSNDSVYGQVFSLGNSSVYSVWQDSMSSELNNPDSINYDIFFKKIDFNGINNDSLTNISNNPGFSEHPQISSSDKNVYITWVDDSNGGKHILYRYSTNYGKSFGNVLQLSTGGYENSNVEISSFGKFVHIVWQQKNLDNSSIVVKSSSDFGKTFGKGVIVSNYADGSYPKIFTDDDVVYVSWNVDDRRSYDTTLNSNNNDVRNAKGIFFSKSDDAGKKFSIPLKLNNGAYFLNGESQISGAKNHVFISWTQKNSIYDNSKLLVAKSSDKGDTFRFNQINLTRSDISNPSNVELTSYGDSVFLTFQASKVNSALNVNDEIFLTLINSHNASDTKIYNVSNNEGFSECPSISINQDNGVISISWEDRTYGNNEVLFRNVSY